MKFGCELLPELIFEKTQIYHANFRILHFSIIFNIKTYPKSCISTRFHVLVMFYIIPDDSGFFWKFSFPEPRGQFFEAGKCLILNLDRGVCFYFWLTCFSKHHVNLPYLARSLEFEKISNLSFNLKFGTQYHIFQFWPEFSIIGP